jgi:hypothetical protein
MVERLGASVVFRETGSADGRIMRSPKKTFICVNQRHRGTPRGRWTAAHEAGHLVCHDNLDAINRIHGGAEKTPKDHNREREADAFAAELTMPDFLFGPRCDHTQPTIPDLDRLGAEFGTSLTATGKRYPRFARAGCALLECEDGRILRAHRSDAFRGEAKQRRMLDEETLAARVSRGEWASAGPERVTGVAWGSEWLDGEMTEHAIRVEQSGIVLVWLSHA